MAARYLGEAQVVITDVTSGEGVLAVMGPKARDLMKAVSRMIFQTQQTLWHHARDRTWHGARTGASGELCGELGWEIYVSSDMAAHTFETLWEAGHDHGLKLSGCI